MDVPDALEWTWRKFLRFCPPAPVFLHVITHPDGLLLLQEMEGSNSVCFTQKYDCLGNMGLGSRRYSRFSRVTEGFIQSSVHEKKFLYSAFDAVKQQEKCWQKVFHRGYYESRFWSNRLSVEANGHCEFMQGMWSYSYMYVYLREGLRWDKARFKVMGLEFTPAKFMPKKTQLWQDEILEKLAEQES